MVAGGASSRTGSRTLLGDPARTAAVERLLRALDDASGLDRLTALAARLLGAQSAQVSLLLSDRQVVASAHGAAAGGEPSGPAADSLCTVTLSREDPLAVADAPADERVNGLPPVTSGAVGAYLGVPLVGAQGQRLGALCVFDAAPRAWSERQVGVLGELAASVVAELELRALGVEVAATAARLGLALDAADIGCFDLDTETRHLVWDERLIRLFGYDASTFVPHLDSFDERVHPHDRERVGAALAHAVDTRGDFGAEYRIVRPDGTVRWVEARGRVLRLGRDEAPRLLGVAYDSTELRDARERLARVLETMTDAFYSLDRSWRFTYVNQQAERLLQRRRDDLLGRVLWEEFPEALGTAFETGYRHAVEADEPVTFEAPYEPLGGLYELSAWPGPDGLSVYFREISERRRAERERAQAVVDRELAYAAAEAANHRLGLLADASTRLAASLEPRQVLERLTEVVVPLLGTWVVVALTADTAATLQGREAVPDPDAVVVVHVAHAHPEEGQRLAEQLAAMTLSTRDEVGVGAVVRRGTPEWLPTVTDETARGLADAPEGVELDLPGSALTVPLVNRGRVLGALTVAEPAGGPVDRALLVDVAGRAAVALDNALLYGAERRTGLTLQRSLLPRELPVVPGLLTAARYLPGTTGAFVGGDWYQGVRVGDRLVLAMGDVMGHGMRSAARMGQLRAIVATLALEGHGPARLLDRLAASVDVLLDLELATLLVASYDPATREITVASAGHPPPLLAPLGAVPRYLDVDPGPPLGSFAATYGEVAVGLAPGDTLVLYTDGLVEDRREPLDVGLERLRQALAELQLPPEQVCDHVLDVLGRHDGAADDVALLVLTVDPDEGGAA